MNHPHEGATPIREGAESSSVTHVNRGPQAGLPIKTLKNILAAPVQLQWTVMAVLTASAVTFRLCELAVMRGDFFGLCTP